MTIPTRVPAILMTAAVLALSTGCGGSPVPTNDAKTSGAPSVPSSSPSPTATATATKVRFTDTTAARKRFANGLATYCTRFYADQRSADETYPAEDRASVLAFDKSIDKMWLRDGKILDKLHPPTELAETFSEFVANERVVYLKHLAVSAAHLAVSAAPHAPGDSAGAGADFNAANEKRHPLGNALHAARCDGHLPPQERTAAIALTKTFEMSTDPDQQCVALVTPEFVRTQWADQPDPMAACVANSASRRRDTKHVTTDIKVSEVTGVDGLTATVHFFDVCGCAVPPLRVARLYSLDGSWKVRWTDYETARPADPVI